MLEPSRLADVLRARVFVVLHDAETGEGIWIIGVGLNLVAAMRMADAGAIEHCGGWRDEAWTNYPNDDALDEEIPEIDFGRPPVSSERHGQIGCVMMIQEWPIRP
jgi:hypothetical protein